VVDCCAFQCAYNKYYFPLFQTPQKHPKGHKKHPGAIMNFQLRS